MADFLTWESLSFGGWFGFDGQSEPTDGVFTDGWYGGAETIQQITDRLLLIEEQLRLHKPLYINDDGRFEELVIYGIENQDLSFRTQYLEDVFLAQNSMFINTDGNFENPIV